MAPTEVGLGAVEERVREAVGRNVANDIEASQRGDAKELTPSLETTPVTRIMRTDVIRATVETPVSVLRARLSTQPSTAFPVVDDGCKLVGLVRQVDLTSAPEGAVAGEVMCTGVVTVNEHAPALRAAALMAFERIHHLPITDARNEVVGLVTSLDVLGFIAELGGYLLPGPWRRSQIKKPDPVEAQIATSENDDE